MDLSDTGPGEAAPVFYSSREGSGAREPVAVTQSVSDDGPTQMEESEPVTETEEISATPSLEEFAERLNALTARVEALEGQAAAASEPENSTGMAECEPDSPTEASAPPEAPAATVDPAQMADALRTVLDERPDATGELRAALDAMASAANERGERIEGALAGLEASVDRLLTRPAPAPDLTMQKQGFARVATALSVAIGRFDAIATETRGAIGRIEENLAAAPAAAPAPEAAQASVPEEPGRLDATLASFVDRLDALVKSMGENSSAPGPDLSNLPDRLDTICTRLTEMLESQTAQGEASLAEDLRDLRTLVAELIADNRRLQVA